jgi:RsiW-degrading membrane proteinase PrsW (M82 family)
LNITDFFANPTFWGIGLAVVFGAIWLVFLAPQKLNRVTAWLVLLMGAAVFAPCIVWIQVPLQSLVTDLLLNWLGQNTLMNYVYLTAIPIILLSGIVQEGAKLIPTVVFWLFKERSLDPKLGLTMGALAGAGFGILEA